MARRKSAGAATRVSVSVREDIRVEAPRRPELLGLPSGASRAKVFERLLERGWDTVLTEQRHRRQLDLYAAYARDPERQAVARADQQELARGRVV